MSCADTEEKVLEPQTEKVHGTDEPGMKNGKPCIDFQPDDRWQIKEENESQESVTNSKIKDATCSNGRRSQRLRSSKNYAALNGEADDSSSDNDAPVTNTVQAIVHTEEAEKSENQKIRSKRKRTRLNAELDNGGQNKSMVYDKKIKVDDTECGIIENCSDEDSEQIAKEDAADSETPMTSEVNTTSSESKEKSVKEDLDCSIEILEEEDETPSDKVSPENSSDKIKAEVKVDECTASSDADSNSEKLTKDNSDMNNDVDIEIINVNDEPKKSDEESDSEIQVINLEGAEPKPEKKDFATSSDSDMSLSAGYMYYNSLKEKIPNFKAGDYKPVKFPHTGTLLLADNEVIIESPSLLVPLLIKESDEFPKLEGEEKKANSDSSTVLTRPNTMSKKNFFQSSVGQFLINLGTSRVQEWYHRDMKRVKLKQLKSGKSGNTADLEKTVAIHDKRHTELKEINAIFNFRLRHCKFCDFKTESLTVMEGHYLTPHLSPRREYKCSFCVYLTRDPGAIAFHFEAMHNKKAVLDSNIPFHECTFCSFEHHLKNKVNVHMNRCRKHFLPSQNLAPPFDFEFPGVTTKPVTIADVVGHRRLLLSSAKNRLPVPEDNNSAYTRKKLASVLSKLSGQPAYTDIKNTSIMKQLIAPQSLLPPMSAGSSIQLPPGIVITRPRGQPIPQMRPMGRFPQPRGVQSIRGQLQRRGVPYAANITSAASHLASSGISITPVSRTAGPIRTGAIAGVKNVTLTPISTASNRTVSQKPGPPQPVALFSNMAGTGGLLGQPPARLPLNMNLRPLRPTPPFQRLNTPPSQVVKGSSGNTFVVCEICDSYIKDLEELRTHMNWVHKVKIHPKMLVSRPPLNCQKCQWRFFTDQGLERHLLGAHGLVTTNMQEMANKNQDGGRCIICGAVFTYKLVSHMTQVHKVTLKPAHLSYKCTVCTATFTLYRLFESHVYNEHSGSAKRPAEDSPVDPPPPKKVIDESSARRCKDCNVVTENMQEHLIKKHIKNCSVKLCRIEKCKKCLYSEKDEMLVIRMSDFGLDDEDLEDSSDDSSSESSEEEEKTG